VPSYRDVNRRLTLATARALAVAATRRAESERAAVVEAEAAADPCRGCAATATLPPPTTGPECRGCERAAALALHLAVSARYPEPVPDDARGPLAALLRGLADRLEAAGSYRDRPREVALVIGALRDEAARWDGETGRLRPTR
jgi:hypothetical protein